MGTIGTKRHACIAGFMLLCEIRARQRIRLETILPVQGKGFVMAASEIRCQMWPLSAERPTVFIASGLARGSACVGTKRSSDDEDVLSDRAKAQGLLYAQRAHTVAKLRPRARQGPVQLLSRGASLIACSAARDSLAAITDALAPPAHPAIASLDGVESFSSTKAVRSDMRAGMLGSLSGKLSSRRLPRESTGDASRASCFPFTSASRSVVRTSGADSTWPGAGLGTPLAWIDR